MGFLGNKQKISADKVLHLPESRKYNYNTMRLVFFLLSLLLIAAACEAPKKTTGEKPTTEESEVAKYVYSIQNVEVEASGCTTADCPKVTLNYPVFEEGLPLHENINQEVDRQLRASLSDFIMEADGKEPLDELIEMFLSDYKAFKETFPESQTPWYVTIDVIVSYTSRSFISLALNSSSYTGGTHPNTNINYINIDESGERITSLDYFFNSREKITDLAEKQFRAQHNLQPDQSLSEKGFLFENDEFSLPDNFGFTSSGVVFYYNSYEIAPYAEGPTALIIPFYKLKSIYKHKIT